MIEKWIKTIKSGLKRHMELKDIDENQLEEMINQGITLVDVRSPQEFEEGHLDGAICIPSYEIQATIKTIIPNKEEKMVLYCDSGGRSKKAQKILEKMGYNNVYNLCKSEI